MARGTGAHGSEPCVPEQASGTFQRIVSDLSALIEQKKFVGKALSGARQKVMEAKTALSKLTEQEGEIAQLRLQLAEHGKRVAAQQQRAEEEQQRAAEETARLQALLQKHT